MLEKPDVTTTVSKKPRGALGAGGSVIDPGFNGARAQRRGTELIILGGYAPAESSFGRGLDLIGERLEARLW
ncbi:MAG: hypothetical protein CM1200mP36_05460 [Gammaproteobacteria bacterium]|nr:MAG: hypothetical protein CM1200mP36_05460 [Gammaproteobacteria bacterium]